MRTLATKQPINDFAKQNKKGEREDRVRSISPLSTGMPLLQRKCACGGGCPRCKKELGIQTKLKISEPGDRYEQEADRIADEVMRMPEPSIQRQIEGEEEEEEMVQRKAISSSISPVNEGSNQSEVPSIVHEVLRSPGQPLNPETRTFMESRFGHDFSQVRVHTDGKAPESAQTVKALAYTLQGNIVFGSGQYAPETIAGRKLLAHELTHVLQQRGTQQSLLQRAETDTSAGCASLTDSMTDVNDRINAALTNARSSAGGVTATIIDGLFDELGRDTSLGRTAIENWAATLGSRKVSQPTRSTTKYAGVNYGIWLQPLFPILNPTMRVNNICIGSDKLGHFLQQGHEYYVIAHRSGASSTVADAERYGRSTEAGGYGLTTTGVFSNADLEANRQGLRFYEDLTASPSMSFDISHYINLNWNEETNPSHYEASVGQTVWRNLLNGSWTGTFSSSTNPAQAIITNLSVGSSNTTLTGNYGYVVSGGSTVNGTISNGRITHQTNSLGAVTGVQINYDWQSGSNSGQGFWISSRENELRGRWGNGSSNNNGGDWNMTKSRTPLTIPSPPLSPAALQADCLRQCEAAFSRCVDTSSFGGLRCLAQRSSCFMNCAHGS